LAPRTGHTRHRSRHSSLRRAATPFSETVSPI
jgi:hypothetical protein